MESSATSVANDYCFIGICSSDCWESYCDCALRVTPVSSKLILLNTFVEIHHLGKSCKGISEAIVSNKKITSFQSVKNIYVD